mgnify:CR=1 FL=1
MFLYIDPLKQGLKRKRIISLIPKHNMFLYIDPLKQGLKHDLDTMLKNAGFGFYT